MQLKATLLALALVSPHAATAAQDYTKRPIKAVKTVAPPAIDGDLSDPCWKDAPKAETFVDRQLGVIPPATDQTFAWILYDEKYIYVAFKALESKPDQIAARETVRDSKYSQQGMFSDDNEDNFELSLDPFQTRRFEDLTQFSVNAIGTRSAKIGGGRANKSEWKGDWEAAAKRTADGWTAEMRIPWAILNYPRGGKAVNMGINFKRFQFRTKVQSYWSNIGPNFFNELAGVWTGVEVPKGSFKPRLSILPYILPGVNTTDPTFRSGIDGRLTLTPELTAVGSINPDFATIEGAVESIQFQRGERFVGERRPFFLEGRDYINGGGMGGGSSYFYSRRIENFDAGMKMYGKLSPVDSIGVLHAVDFSRRSDFVGRYRHDLSETSSVSATMLNLAAVDDNNSVGILNHNARWGKLGYNSEIGISTGKDAGGATKTIGFNYQDKLLFWSIRAFDIAEKFRDADGLIPFVDYKGFRAFAFWNAQWRKGPWRQFNIFAGPQYSWHSDGRPYQRGGSLEMEIETKSDWAFTASLGHSKFDLQRDSLYSLGVTNGISNRFRQWGLNYTTGIAADSPYTFFGPQFSVRALRKLDLGYAGSIENFQGHAQQHILTMGYELSPSRAIGGRVVVQDSRTNWYLSYRSSGERGTEIFFILGDPNADRFRQTAAVKLVFAL